MKIKIIFFLMLLSCLSLNAQEQTQKIKLHSISFSPLGIYLAERDGGLAFNADVSFYKGTHLFKVYVGFGSEFTINFGGGTSADSFVEYNLLYGKEIPIKKWLAIDLFAGLGYFRFNYNQGSSTNEYKKDVVGLPLQSRVKFITGKTFSLGLQLNGNINSATTIYQSGLFLQWRL